jgi:hypothetical protein
LEQADKVKFTIQFRGREVTHQELGRQLSERILESLSDIGELEGSVSRSGRLHSFLVARRKDYKPKLASAPSAPGEAAADGAESRPAPASQPSEPSAPRGKPDDVLVGGEEAAILPS